MKYLKNITSWLLLTAFICAAVPLQVFCNEALRQNETDPARHLQFGIPGFTEQQIERSSFVIGYSHKMRQALWISYILTAKDLSRKKVRRTNKFSPDPAIKINPVQPQEYIRTGYDRGHLVPAADMSHSKISMEHSFFMSNISPQLPGCNRGIWKRLESQIRRWAAKNGELCIITGPIFSNTYDVMGNTGVAVPTAFYKVILDMTPPMKMIGFIVPNQTSKRQLASFAVPVDKVEAVTGWDFFSNLDDSVEDMLEADCSFESW